MNGVNRAIQRLAARGDVTVRMELRTVIDRSWTERSWSANERKLNIVSYTAYKDAPQPTWIVKMHRSSDAAKYATDKAPLWTWELMGFGTYQAENVDLLAALADVLDQSAPPDVSLDDLVYSRREERSQ